VKSIDEVEDERDETMSATTVNTARYRWDVAGEAGRVSVISPFRWPAL
jgi:hypothetical protein